MRTSIRLAAIAAALIISLASCADAGAGNDRKKAKTGDNGYVTELTTESFNTKVCDITKEDSKFLGKRPAIVDFNATWCGPCKRLAPILNELSVEYKGKIDIYKVDVDKNPDLAKAFRISSIPALLFIPMEGDPQMLIGLRSKDALKKDIDAILLK